MLGRCSQTQSVWQLQSTRECLWACGTRLLQDQMTWTPCECVNVQADIPVTQRRLLQVVFSQVKGSDNVIGRLASLAVVKVMKNLGRTSSSSNSGDAGGWPTLVAQLGPDT